MQVRGLDERVSQLSNLHTWVRAHPRRADDRRLAKATGATIDRIRTQLPAGSLVGGAAAENHDLEKVLSERTPLVFGLLIGLGFLLLLVALGSPLVAFVGVVTNLASIAGAFGVGKWIFQDGHLSGLLGFAPQGYVDALGSTVLRRHGLERRDGLHPVPVVNRPEHYDLSSDPHHAMRMALADVRPGVGIQGRLVAPRLARDGTGWNASDVSAGFQRAVRPAIHTSNS
jgi:hypothetical protein